MQQTLEPNTYGDLESNEISAQKKYKLQLQAEINKLKEKYSAHLTAPP